VMRDKWRLLIAGGCLGSGVGVIGASIFDPEVGFPAWVDLTGAVVGFGLGVLTSGVVALLRHAMWSSRGRHQREDALEEELRPRVWAREGKMLDDNTALVRRLFDEVLSAENLAAADEIMANEYIEHAVGAVRKRRTRPGVHGPSHARGTVEWLRAQSPDLETTIECAVTHGPAAEHDSWQRVNGRYWARTSDPQLVELVLSQLS
jgi:hypothetical protein